MKKINTLSWWRTERPLASPRIKILLSNRITSIKLSKAIRNSRAGLKSPFSIEPLKHK